MVKRDFLEEDGYGAIWDTEEGQLSWKSKGTVILVTWTFKSHERMKLIMRDVSPHLKAVYEPGLYCVLCNGVRLLNQEGMRHDSHSHLEGRQIEDVDT